MRFGWRTCSNLQDDIAVFENVVFAFCHYLAFSLYFRLIAQLLQDGEIIYNNLNERLFKIAMDDTSGLRRLGAATNRPLADFVSASGEEASEVESLAHGSDNFRNSRVNSKIFT